MISLRSSITPETEARWNCPACRLNGGDGLDAVPSIQFCDVLADLAGKLLEIRIVADERGLLESVLKAGAHLIDINGVRPGTTFFEEDLPRKLSGPDAVDKLIHLVGGR